ncbi:MAG: ATP synthase F0 subunit B [Acidobacteria bacterium]|nr:ATP synthase F0 subunit B [Acidobacteriota bacterium]
MTDRIKASTMHSFIVALWLLLCLAPACAQASAASAQGADLPKQKQVSGASGDFGSQLARESREAAGEERGESEELKKSAAVDFVARLTGMSLQHAYWLCMLLNFIIIAAAIAWLSRLHLTGFFRSRTVSIQTAIQQAQKASQDADRRLTEIHSRLAKLDSEIAVMQSAADGQAVAEEARIQAAAAEDMRKIAQSVRQEIAAATKAARRELKMYAADLAVALAQRQIRVDNGSDQSLVRSFAEQLGSEKNGTGKGGR